MMTPYRIALLTLLLVAAVPGQQILYQTLPAGWEAQEGNSTTAFPLNTASDQVWQWHYDAGEFAASGPITITHLAMRSKAGFVIQAFNFPSFEVTFIEASTEHTTSSHQAEFAANILRSQLVRSGSWSSVALFPLPFSTVGGFAEMGLDEPFVYDPSTGNDLIIQVRKCGTNLVWGTMVDAAAGTGGNRYGHTSDCLATTQNFNNTNVVPIVRIGYHLARQTLPQGYMTTDGNGSSGQPFTPTGDQKWQWHYDSDEFEVQGPIAIRQIWVRPRHPSENLGAFSFNSLKVTLGSSTTHYAPGFHASTFSVNLDQQEIVRRGTWSGGPVAPSANTTADWVSLNLGQGYVYDPSTGRDFVVQIEKCGPANHWSTTLDGILAAAGTGGGCRYGNTTSCTALDDNTPAANDFVPIIRIDYEPVTSANEVVVRFPYREDFDDSAIGNVPPRGWHNQEGENVDPPGDWVIATGSTPSLNTGPTADHTTGISNYVYVEDSLSDNPRVVLTTPVFDLTGLANPRISFWLHSQNAGGGVSTLDLEVVELPSGHATGLLPLPFGATGPTWVEQTFDLSPYQGLRVAIRFTVNNDNVGFYHDVAIDDVRVYDLTFQNGQAPTTFASLSAIDALDENGQPVSLGLPGPYYSRVHFGENLGLTVSGSPNQPFIVFAGTLVVGAQFYPGIGQVDVTDPGSFVVVNGVDGSGVIPGVFYTSAAGSFTFAGPSTLPPGLAIPLQAAVFTGGPTVLGLSNALVVQTL